MAQNVQSINYREFFSWCAANKVDPGAPEARKLYLDSLSPASDAPKVAGEKVRHKTRLLAFAYDADGNVMGPPVECENTKLSRFSATGALVTSLGEIPAVVQYATASLVSMIDASGRRIEGHKITASLDLASDMETSADSEG